MAPKTIRKLLLLSNSRQPGLKYMEHCSSFLKSFLERNGVTKILFVPYALKDHDYYAETVKNSLSNWGLKVESIHQGTEPIDEVNKAEAIYIGGGNTFRLLSELYEKKLVDAIRKRVLQDGIPYIGSSAGTNVATINICTTNDMPIIYPPTFNALNLVPFNINPHYVDPEPNSKHMGETREVRIGEYHELDDSKPVVGLREGSWLECTDDKLILHGEPGGKLFASGKPPKEITNGENISYLLTS